MKELAQKRLVQLLDQQQADSQAQKQRQTQQQVKRQLQVTKDGAAVEGSEEAQNDARLRTGCYFPAAVALNGATVTPDKLVATFHELQAGTGFAQKDIENRLAVQITTLDFMFYDLLTRSHNAPNIDKASRLIELAMRCQEQSRRTITTLDNIRNPKKPSQFIKSYVDKQVNQLKVEQQSHTSTALESSPYAAMDTGSTATAAGTDSDLAAVAVINGTNQC